MPHDARRCTDLAKVGHLERGSIHSAGLVLQKGLSEGVTPALVLHLNHLGPEVGHDSGRDGAGQDGAEVDDAHVVERQAVGHGHARVHRQARGRARDLLRAFGCGLAPPHDDEDKKDHRGRDDGRSGGHGRGGVDDLA